jgi:hypothetical protein
VGIAMQRHEAGEAWVIPILVRSVDWETSSIGKLQALPYSLKPVANWNNRDSAFTEISKNIRSLVMDLQATRNNAEEKGIGEDAQTLAEQRTINHQRNKKRDLYKTIAKSNDYTLGEKLQHKVGVFRKTFSVRAVNKRSKGFSLLLLFLFSIFDLLVLPVFLFQYTRNTAIAITTFLLSLLLFSMGITNKNNIVAAAITFVYCVVWTILGYLYLSPAYHLHVTFLGALLICVLFSCLQLVLFHSKGYRRRWLPIFPKV